MYAFPASHLVTGMRGAFVTLFLPEHQKHTRSQLCNRTTQRLTVQLPCSSVCCSHDATQSCTIVGSCIHVSGCPGTREYLGSRILLHGFSGETCSGCTLGSAGNARRCATWPTFCCKSYGVVGLGLWCFWGCTFFVFSTECSRSSWVTI